MRKLRIGHEILGEISSFEIKNNFDLKLARLIFQNKKILEISKDLSNSMGSTIMFDYKVDKDLIGGLKLQLGSFMIDTSIKSKLKKYEQSMLEE